jgi:hypothetical protein
MFELIVAVAAIVIIIAIWLFMLPRADNSDASALQGFEFLMFALPVAAIAALIIIGHLVYRWFK